MKICLFIGFSLSRKETKVKLIKPQRYLNVLDFVMQNPTICQPGGGSRRFFNVLLCTVRILKEKKVLANIYFLSIKFDISFANFFLNLVICGGKIYLFFYYLLLYTHLFWNMQRVLPVYHIIPYP